jgi:hypothetical protein
VTSGSESTQQGDSLQSLALASSRQVTSVMPGDVISLPIFAQPARIPGGTGVTCDVCVFKRYSFKCLEGRFREKARGINSYRVGEPGDPPGRGPSMS